MLAVMWPLAKSQAVAEPEPPIAEPPVDRVGQTQQRVRELKAQLDALDTEMLQFKTKHRVRTNRFGLLLSIECATLNGRAPIEREWRGLLQKRDGLVTAWHAALFSWSEAKGGSK